MTEEEMAKLPKTQDVIEQIENGEASILDEKEKFLQKIDPEMRFIVEQRLKKKELQKKEKKETARSLANLTKEMLEGDYIDLGDDISLSINELLVSKVTCNALRNNKLSFRDLNDAQKVIDNDTTDNRNGFTLILNTNGQDLGS